MSASDVLVGTWRLVSYENRGEDGGVTYPFGRDASGYVTYTPEGYMSIAWHKGNRRGYAASDFTLATLEEKAATAESYLSYYGRYEVSGGRVVHHVEGSIVPDWVGVDRVRLFRLDGGRLTLETTPVVYGGRRLTSVLVFEKI